MWWKGHINCQRRQDDHSYYPYIQNIVNLYPGLAEDAQKDGAELLQPVTDTVTYKDGTSEEVNGFDVPVPAIDEEFDLALIGTKGVWYDHKVSVSNPVAVEE